MKREPGAIHRPGQPGHVWSCVPGASSQASNRLCQCGRGGVGTAGSGWHGGQTEGRGLSGDPPAREDDGSASDGAAPTNPGPVETELFQSRRLLGFFLDRKETPFPDPRS